MKKKTVLTSLLLVLLMAVTVMFTGCGGGEEATQEEATQETTVQEEITLESFINDTPDLKEQIDAVAADNNMEIEISENTMTYYYNYPEVLTEDEVQIIKDEADKLMEDGMSETFEGEAEKMRENTGIEDITMTIIFRDPEGTEICSYDF